MTHSFFEKWKGNSLIQYTRHNFHKNCDIKKFCEKRNLLRWKHSNPIKQPSLVWWMLARNLNDYIALFKDKIQQNKLKPNALFIIF